MSSTSVSALVVCPTEYGGQIEHAVDLAAAIADVRSERTAVISRPGAAGYFGAEIPNVRFIESLPPRRSGSGFFGRLKKAALQVRDLVAEQVLLRRAVVRHAPSVIVLDASRYPFPSVYIPRRSRAGTRVILYLHNVRPHNANEAASLRGFVLGLVERRAVASADEVAIHGEEQREDFVSRFARQPLVTQLPDTTYLHVQSREIMEIVDVADFRLCLGEVRRNKGIETAIAAARIANVPLVIAGAPESVQYGEELADLAGAARQIWFVPRFLSREEFDWALRNATSVVLPYLHFAAQSGVATRAAAVGTRIIASDLPSLREQLHGYELASFFPVGDAEALASALNAETEPTRFDRTSDASESRRSQWRSVVEQIWGGRASA